MPTLMNRIIGLFARSSSAPVAAGKRKVNLRLEALEARDVPSTTPLHHFSLGRHRAHLVAVRGIHHPGDRVSLNPQPLPPRAVQAGYVIRLGDRVSLNPQPLPPRAVQLSRYVNLGDRVSLNPQPLPPRYRLLGHRIGLHHAAHVAHVVVHRVR